MKRYVHYVFSCLLLSCAADTSPLPDIPQITEDPDTIRYIAWPQDSAESNIHRKHILGAVFLTFPPIYSCGYCNKEYSVFDYCSNEHDYVEILNQYGPRGTDSFFMAKWNEADTVCRPGAGMKVIQTSKVSISSIEMLNDSEYVIIMSAGDTERISTRANNLVKP